LLPVVPWYIAVDGTNGKIYVTDHLLSANSVYVNTTSGQCNFAAIPSQPSSDKNPLGIAVNPTYSKVYIAFDASGTVDVYNFATSAWLCGPDSFGANLYGIAHFVSADSYGVSKTLGGLGGGTC
jgi:DNA-binding beta-propeller fold protein YncE